MQNQSIVLGRYIRELRDYPNVKKLIPELINELDNVVGYSNSLGMLQSALRVFDVEGAKKKIKEELNSMWDDTDWNDVLRILLSNKKLSQEFEEEIFALKEKLKESDHKSAKMDLSDSVKDKLKSGEFGSDEIYDVVEVLAGKGYTSDALVFIDDVLESLPSEKHIKQILKSILTSEGTIHEMVLNYLRNIFIKL